MLLYPLQCQSLQQQRAPTRRLSRGVGVGVRGPRSLSPGDWHADSGLRKPPVQKPASIPSALALH